MRKKLKFTVLLLASGCCVGPNFHTPDMEPAGHYGTQKPPESTVSVDMPLGGAQVFIDGKAVESAWWKSFMCEKLNATVAGALAASPTLEAAQCTLRAAREDVNAQFGSLVYPEVTAGVVSSRQKISTTASGHFTNGMKPFSLHNASVSLSYVFDIFGGGRRTLESLQAKVDYQSYKLKAARLSLAANVVNTIVEEASIRAQIAAIQDIIASQEKQLSMLEQQLALGGMAQAGVLLQRARVEENRAMLPALEKLLTYARYRLAVLCGKFPAQADKLPSFTLSELTLPKELPVNVPSSWVSYRPDIRAAQALMHEACARVGVATADLFPKFTISGNYGSQSNVFKDILDSNKDIWSIAYALAQPVIDGGTRRAKRRGAQALYEQATAQYREVLLNAFENVADTLAALESDAKALHAQAAAERATYDSYEMMLKQFKVGGISYDVVLDADRQYQQALIARIKAQAQRLYDSAALFQAMGAGEENL